MAEVRAKAELTERRRDFAKAAMAGLLADHRDHSDEVRPGETCAQAVARLAVEHADALIAELNKQSP